MLEYLKRSLRASTAASSVAMSSSVERSGNARASCQKSPSQPSRTTPAPWASSSRTRTSASGVPSRSASQRPTGSSSRRRPCSTSRMTAVAVNVLECEAMRKRWPGVSGVRRLDVGQAVRRSTARRHRRGGSPPGRRGCGRTAGGRPATSRCRRPRRRPHPWSCARITATLVRDADRSAGRVAPARGPSARRIPSPRAHDRDRHRTCRQRRPRPRADARARVHHLAGDEAQRPRGLGRRGRPHGRRGAPAAGAEGERHRRHPRPDGARPRPLHPADRHAGRADRPEDHRGDRALHVQRAAPLLGRPGAGQRPERQRPDGRPVRPGHHRGHRRDRHQGGGHQVRHRPAGHHPRRRARPAGVRPDPPGHRRADHDPHRTPPPGGASSSRRSSGPRASTSPAS